MTVTAAFVRKSFLDPAMDARAHNLRQHELIFNPTPERDSLLEHIDTSCQHVREILRELVASNGAEGALEQELCAAADQLAVDLRNMELNGHGSQAIAAKAVARHIRDPLGVLASGATGAEAVRAVMECRRVLARVPRRAALSSTVRHEIGERKFALLREMVA